MDTKNEERIIQDDLSSHDVARLQASRVIAVDCEMAGLNPHRDPLYVVQICDRDKKINVIKTRDWTQAHHLQTLMTDPSIQKVFHFAIMDCAFLTANLKSPVQNAYCTKIASKLARTYTSTHSLSSLVEELFGLQLDKKQGTTFWGLDLLSPEQLEYAALDVVYLLDIKQKLEEILAKKGILPTGITYLELNHHCQEFIPTLVHLWMSGWDFGKEDASSVFGK